MSSIDVPAFIQTEDRAFVRDTHSKALLNTDLDALTRHRASVSKQEKVDRLQQKVELLESTCARMESQLNSITSMLEKTLHRLTHS